MNKRWIAINLVLLATAGLLGWQLRLSIDRFRAANNIAKIQPVQSVKQQLSVEGALLPLKPPKMYNPAEFGIVPTQNVFSESRSREEKVEAAPVVPVVPELVNKPVLVGVTISGTQRLAAIVDPTIQAVRKTQTKRIGDVYQGYTITDITENRMVLEAGNRREIIPLHDGTKRQPQGGKTTILATRVVSFGGTTGGGGTSATVVSTGAPVRSAAAQGAASAVPIGTAQPGAAAGAAGRATTQQGRPAALTPQTPSANPQPSTPVVPPGSRIIRTPFGDIVRPDTPNP